ncbi:hypothetical protein [Micromonospora sp. NPDC047187]|uniref:hypothetical protein n=1 Tax=Micromonospora sp. NPDC047187 TaxID=3155262 RepID=UPI0033DFF3E5
MTEELKDPSAWSGDTMSASPPVISVMLIPALILLGATLVPLTFLTFAQARTGRWQVPASALCRCCSSR